MPAWLIWLIAAGVLVGIEIASLDLIFIMLAGGAGAAAIAAAVGAPAIAQAVIFAVVSVALLLVVRPIATRHMRATAPNYRSGVAALEGRTALVLEPVDAHHGQVKIDGEIWTARTYDSTQSMETGEEVQVMQINGATALVWKQP
jgi:membrane protein implicated in regulation of membrane protease activity